MSPKELDHRLRDRAETRVTEVGVSVPTDLHAARELVYELQVHQIELELQNEELQRAHADLHAMRDEYAALFELAPIAYVTVQRDSTIGAANLAAATLLRTPRHVLRGAPLARYVDDGDVTAWHRWLRRVFDARKPDHLELRLRRGDGTAVIARADAVAGDGLARVAITDLSEIRTMQRALRDSESRFRDLAEQIEAVLYTIDVDEGTVLYASPAFERIWGRPVAELYDVHARWLPAVHPDHADELRARHAALLRGEGAAAEYRIVRPDGEERWIRDRAFSVADADGVVHRVTGVAYDITHERALEVQLRHAAKLEAVGTLASGVAHDFNNLLMGISGCASIALTQGVPADRVRALLEEIRDAATAGVAITRQLTSFARKPSDQPATTEVDALLSQRTGMLRQLLGEDVEVEVELEAAGVAVPCDPGTVEQVVMNLAANARDAMPRGGTLRIATRVVGGELHVTVADTGVGMAAEVASRAFEPFFTTKPVGRGTGLGLASVYGIVRAAGGRIAIDSAVGAGTRIEIALPIAGETAATATVERAAAAGDETVLLVEDDALVRMTAEHYLQGAGYRVLAADGPRSALDRAAEHPGRIDLLLTDVVLPDMDGPELARKLHEQRPEVTVVFMSAHNREWLTERQRLPPDARSLEKPVSPEQLLAGVRDALRS